MRRLDELLRDNLPYGVSVDVLTVDAEGQDEHVLRSNDWARFRPRIVVAEALGAASIDEAVRSPVTCFLTLRGYVPFAKAVNSIIFVDGARPATPAESRTESDAHPRD